MTAAGVHAADRKSESGDREPYLLYFILLSLPPPFLSTEHIEYSSRRIREKEREIIRFPHNSRTLIVFQREIRDSRHDLCVARINLHLFLPPLPFSTARLLFVLVTQSRWSFILWIREPQGKSPNSTRKRIPNPTRGPYKSIVGIPRVYKYQ